MPVAPTPKPANINSYIGHFSNAVQEILEKIRLVIHKAAPDAKEKISYSMPAFEQKRIVVYFATFKNHIGLYALKILKKYFQNINQEKDLHKYF
ncbi:iron chaperone [Flavobacterium cheongpyeongense]|jgi:uncharacterized protein YdhG (YjbR/CyaY superfamily)|uniref:iron chaperone n=1 Tax=Flavobacterium cheongpyeongense TaxID=2212651 RepID=UPI001E30FE5B|nr:DUF1801 domain-containing protein [Flavobacterium cheongpyeongense]